MSQLQKVRKVIFVANTARFFVMFEQNNIRLLQSMGYEIHCASNFEQERDVDAKNILQQLNVTIHQIDIARSPFSMRNLNAYRQLKALMQQEQFDLVDCHTPMGGGCWRGWLPKQPKQRRYCTPLMGSISIRAARCKTA